MALLRVFGLPAAALGVGGLLVLLARQGAASRPAGAAAVLVLGIAAGVAPLRYGLPAAAMLASLGGFLIDFLGRPAPYWNEAFVLAITARSLASRRLSARELTGVGAVALAYAGYLLTGSYPHAVFWGAKVLLTSVVLTWALARMRLDERTWISAYLGFAAAIVANLVLAVWQRAEGVKALLQLGLPLSERVREGPTGIVRAFGGFTSQAPFAFACALALCWWTGAALARGRPRSVALSTVWLPAAAAAGIFLSYDRTVVAGLVAAALLVGLVARTPHRERLLLLGALAAVAVVVVVVGGRSSWRYVLDGFRPTSPSTRFRTDIWRSYEAQLSPFGEGPGSAGSAYRHLDVAQWKPPVRFGFGWDGVYTPSAALIRAIYRLGYVEIDTGTAERPPLVFYARATSADGPRRLTIEWRNRPLSTVRVPSVRYVAVRARIPRGRGPIVMSFRSARIPGTPGTGYGPPHHLLPLRFLGVRVDGLPLSSSPALRIFERVYQRTLDTNAVAGIQPGVVDNLYLSWLFQYGFVLGIPICALWLAVLLWPATARRWDATFTVAALAGVFLVVAALAVNVWEEAPIDLLTALVFAHAFALRRQASASASPRQMPEA